MHQKEYLINHLMFFIVDIFKFQKYKNETFNVSVIRCVSVKIEKTVHIK